MRGLTPRFVDGLRVTDSAALDSVVSVLAGRTNTGLVAAIGALGARAVGLTGADAKIGLAMKAAPLATISGEHVDLGLVGEPGGGDVALLTDLLQLGYVPVIASVGVAADGTLLNVNADVFAAHLAAALGARRLIVAGTTPGVLDGAGATIAELTRSRRAGAHGIGHGAFGHGREAERLPPRARQRRRRSGDRRRARRSRISTRQWARGCAGDCQPGLKTRPPRERGRSPIAGWQRSAGLQTPDESDGTSGVTTMQTTDDDPQPRRGDEARERACAPDVSPCAGRLRARQRLPPLRRGGPRLPGLHLRDRRLVARAMRIRGWPRRSPRRPRSCCTRRTCTSIRCRGRSRRSSPALSGLPRAFFCNSGTEAVEASLKFARRYWFSKGTPRTAVVALERGFHGRTMGALSVTWDEHYRAPFSPLLDGVTFVSNTDPAELLAAVSEKTAAIIVEPLQGEGGVRPLEPRRWRRRSRRPASAAARCSSPTKCSAASAARACRSTRRRSGLQPDLMATRQGARRRRAGRRGAVLASASPTPRRSAITAAPTAATCSRAGRRWCSSTS